MRKEYFIGVDFHFICPRCSPTCYVSHGAPKPILLGFRSKDDRHRRPNTPHLRGTYSAMRTPNGSTRKSPGEHRKTHPGPGSGPRRHHQRLIRLLLATPATSLTIPAVNTSVVDTIGAGDSYMSALILGLLSAKPVASHRPSSNSSAAQRPPRPQTPLVEPVPKPPTKDELPAQPGPGYGILTRA